jgi:hypothetical protein
MCGLGLERAVQSPRRTECPHKARALSSPSCHQSKCPTNNNTYRQVKYKYNPLPPWPNTHIVAQVVVTARVGTIQVSTDQFCWPCFICAKRCVPMGSRWPSVCLNHLIVCHLWVLQCLLQSWTLSVRKGIVFLYNTLCTFVRLVSIFDQKTSWKWVLSSQIFELSDKIYNWWACTIDGWGLSATSRLSWGQLDETCESSQTTCRSKLVEARRQTNPDFVVIAEM